MSKHTPRFIEGEEARSLGREWKWSRLSPYLRQHGREAWSYATLQDGMEYLVVDGVGYLSYLTARHPILAPRGMKAVFSDPVAAVEDYPLLVQALLERCPHACFAPASTELARMLRPLGFKCVLTGSEPVIPIRTFDLDGDWKTHDVVRRARNEARRHGLLLREEPDVTAVDRDALARVSRDWIARKPIHDREIRVYARPALFENEPDVRKFVAYDPSGAVVGFAFYDPIYRDGAVVGYSANVSRCDEARYGKLATALHLEAARVFRAEGKEALNLCLSPFVGIDEAEFRDDAFTRVFFKLSGRYGGRIYNFGGLATNRVRYHVPAVPKYFASRALLPPNDAYLAYREAGMVDGYLPMVGRFVRGMVEGIARDLFGGRRAPARPSP